MPSRRDAGGTGSPQPHRSLWLRESLGPHAGDGSSESLSGAISADVCIVGGGFTGLWTAIRLAELEPSLEIVLLEADVCGYGASGRNGGFVMSWWSKFGSLTKACGSEEATRLAHSSADSVQKIGDFCELHGIDAHFHKRGWLWTATSPAQVGAWDETIARIEEAGSAPFQRLGADDVATMSGSRAHLAGVLEATAAVVHPGHLVRGLRRVALERGVRIFEHSRMTHIERSGSRPQVRTAGGHVAAERVVLAINAWAARLPEYRPFLVVVASDVIATERMPERLADLGWEPGLPVSDSRRLVNYYRTTDDGRIVFGKGGGTLALNGKIGPAFDGPSPRESDVAESMFRAYPSLRGIAAEHSWRGPIDYAASGMPSFLPVGPAQDTFCAAGYSGNGVGPSYIGGLILASLVLGRDDEWASCGLTRPPAAHLPREPIRYLGGRLVRAAIARKERIEDRGGRAGPITLGLSRLDPTGFVEATQSRH
jgi:glycine/D-amino acid oxidase-like deaminating enzyme